MATNDQTGSPGESDEQFEFRMRKQNPFLDDASIKKLVADRKSKETIVQNSKTIYPDR